MLLAMTLAASLSVPATVGAQQATPQQPVHPAALPPRQANYAWDQDLLRASFSYRDVMSDPALLKKMASGLPMVIAMRAYLFQQGNDAPVVLAARVCRVAYDLWDEVYRIRLSEQGHERDQAALAPEGVLRACTEARDLPIVRRGDLTPGQPYFLGVLVDVNPVSQDMIEQIRRWIARPTGSTGIGPTDALFGGFVQLFVRQIATSDKSLTFRTQDVVP